MATSNFNYSLFFSVLVLPDLSNMCPSRPKDSQQIPTLTMKWLIFWGIPEHCMEMSQWTWCYSKVIILQTWSEQCWGWQAGKRLIRYLSCRLIAHEFNLMLSVRYLEFLGSPLQPWWTCSFTLSHPKKLKANRPFYKSLLLLWEIRNNNGSGGAARVIPEVAGSRGLLSLTGQLTSWNPNKIRYFH